MSQLAVSGNYNPGDLTAFMCQQDRDYCIGAIS